MACQRSKLRRDGTNQLQRFLPAFETSYIQIDERELEDVVNFAFHFAEEIAYYNKHNLLDGNWQSFFSELRENINTLHTREDHPPHLALFITFLQLLRIFKDDLNSLKLKHVLFYYQDVLKITRRSPLPDSVHVIFQLAKNATTLRLGKGTLFKAGKDVDGNEILYEADKETVLNKGNVVDLKTVFVDIQNQDRIYQAGVANSLDGQGTPFPTKEMGWPTLGEQQIGKDPEARNMTEAEVGFAISSPILLLKEGTRTITLELEFVSYTFSEANYQSLMEDNVVAETVINRLRTALSPIIQNAEDFELALANNFSAANPNLSVFRDEVNNPLRHINEEDLEDMFLAYGSGESEWITLNIVAINKISENRLEFTFSLDVTQPAWLPYNQEALAEPIKTHYPVLKLLLNPRATTYGYKSLRYLQVASYRIDVDVEGVRDLIVQNEEGLLDVSQSFTPFGSQPHVGSHFYFGSYEVFQKELNKLRINLHWVDLPNNFSDHYDIYGGDLKNPNRNVHFTLRKNQSWIPLSASEIESIELFELDGDDLVSTVFAKDLEIPNTFGRDPEMRELITLTPSTQRGYGRFTLKDVDFGHGVFPEKYAEKALQIATTEPGGLAAVVLELPNPPYTPKLQFLSLDYESRISGSVPSLVSSEYEKIFHIEPFGVQELTPEHTSVFWLPQFDHGNLYIGIEALRPPQNLSILFQQLEGSANPDVAILQGDTQWAFRTKLGWMPLTGLSITTDTTLGLQTSGIIEFSISSKAIKEHSLLPSGRHWLRATINKDPSGINQTLGIHAQVIQANQLGSLVNAGEILKPGTINKMVQKPSTVKKITQPFTSFGGRSLERNNHYFRRVSERLRHKQRAITIYDYEHLVLEAFPELYKVKCMNHSNSPNEVAPGHVTLLTIPDLRNQNAANPLQPKASSVLRESVRQLLLPHVSFFTEIKVENPKYEPILIDLCVAFLPGFDGGFYGNLLNEELKRFLSPWAFEEGEDIVFEGRVYKSQVLLFIEQRPYVDYVTDFHIFHQNRGKGIGSICVGINFEVGGNIEVSDFAEASTSRSILVSTDQHLICVITPGEYPCARSEVPSGIGGWIIGVSAYINQEL